MTRNVEIKARTSDLVALRKGVAEVSDSGPELLVQRDTFYAVPKGRLKLREFGDGTAELIYYERLSSNNSFGAQLGVSGLT